MMFYLNPSRKLAVRRRAGCSHVLSVLPTPERQSLFLFGWLLLATTLAVQAQFTFTTNDGTITITGYTGADSAADIPNTITGLPVTGIGDSAFEGDTNMASVTIPSSVTSIGWYAFAGCASLTNVTIPNNVTRIGNYAFSDCISLTSLTIPSSVTFIGYAAFRSCTSLTAISVETNNLSYSSVNGVLFNRSQTTLIRYPGGKAGSYSIPNSVTLIWGHAFEECTNLNSLTIPNGVTNVRDLAFGSCSSLTNVTIGNSVASIGDYAFAGCTSLTMACFQGNAPDGNSSVFSSDTIATAYYLPGTTGWGLTFGGIQTALWALPYPVILNNTVGVRFNQFGFTISWATNIPVVVEATSNLANPIWSPVATNNLPGGWFHFNDRESTNYPRHFYRVRSQ